MAFARLMFEHGAFEREVRELQDAVARDTVSVSSGAINGALAKGRIAWSS